MSTTNLMFLAPPPVEGGDDHLRDTAGKPARGSRSATQSARPGRDGAAETLRMTRGAREAATGMGISEQDVRQVLDAADEVAADPNNPARTRFRRGDVSVLTGPDGVVLRVGRERGKRR